MTIPIFFSINSAKIENGILNIDLLYDNEFRDLQINVIGYSDFRTKIFREYKEVYEKKNMNFNLINVLPESKIEIFLFSLRLPELQIEESVYMPLIQPLLPFTQTYNQFHKLEELKKILTKPETLDSKHRSDLFEKAVCDLLSLCGLSTIHLGDHEVRARAQRSREIEQDIQLEKEHAELDSLIDRYLDWVETKELNKIRLMDVQRFLRENDLDLLRVTERDIFDQAQIRMEEKNKEKIMLEREELPSLVDQCVDWARVNGLRSVTKADIETYLLENNLDIMKETQRSLYAMTNTKLKIKRH
jgi:hypothetical protein